MDHRGTVPDGTGGVEEIMKACSIKQPWAWAIQYGFKTIETRTWHTSYRGDLLIVSSKLPDKVMMGSLAREQGLTPELMASSGRPLLYGKALAVAKLVDCRPMSKLDEDAAMCERYPGAFSWVLEDVYRIEPFDVKGQLGLYLVDTANLVRRIAS
jgi:hypothetical protein